MGKPASPAQPLNHLDLCPQASKPPACFTFEAALFYARAREGSPWPCPESYGLTYMAWVYVGSLTEVPLGRPVRGFETTAEVLR